MKKITLVGAATSGKDYLLNGLVEIGLVPCTKSTTRPIRNGEIRGVTYNYMDNESFVSDLDNMVVYQKFEFLFDGMEKLWYYGIHKQEFEKCQVCIMTPMEINSLTTEERNACTVIYVNIDESIRRKRLEKRNDNNDSIDRRIESDAFDFKDFTDYDIEITDPMFNVSEIYGSL